MHSILFTLLVLSIITQVFCGNVLVLCPMCTRSHKNIIEATVESLAKRNHSITIVSSYKTPTESRNVRDIIVMDGFDLFATQNMLESREQGVLGILGFDPYKMLIAGCHTTYQNPDFMKLLDVTFDLIIMDAFGNNCLQPFAYRLKAPVIRSMPLPSPAALAIQTGNYLPPSFVPDPMLPFGENMTFLQRILNTIVPKIVWTMYTSWYGEYEKIARQYLGEDIPTLAELDSEISMTLQNSHFSINHPRPTMPDFVEVGGVHCRPGKPLPNDLEEFVSGSKDGVIVFSLGSIFKGRDMPAETIKAIVNAFSSLKQRVLWKWDKDIPDLPSNIKLSKWLPLQDVLAHANTKLFITHGGLLSTQEAIYHGVPMVGMPLFFDQDLNINRYVELEVAVFVEILNLEEKDLFSAIETVLTNPKYKENIQKLSSLFRDQPQSAIDTAVFWSEYVMRHKGAPQLRSIARKLNFIQFHSLDVIAFLTALLFGGVGLTVWVTRKLFRKLFGTSSHNSDQKKLQ